MNTPTLCPYCGSIENHGNICDWCHSPIAEDYVESEDKKMKVTIEFADLDPAQALELIKCAAAHSAEERAYCAPEMTPPAPVQPAAPGAPVPKAAPAVPVQAVPPAITSRPQVAPVTPVIPVAPAPVPTQPAPAAPPTAVKKYTADELALAARPICEIPGGREKLLDLLHSFTYTDSTGAPQTVQSIMDMPPEQYPALANGIRQLGGRI